MRGKSTAVVPIWRIWLYKSKMSRDRRNLAGRWTDAEGNSFAWKQVKEFQAISRFEGFGLNILCDRWYNLESPLFGNTLSLLFFQLPFRWVLHPRSFSTEPQIHLTIIIRGRQRILDFFWNPVHGSAVLLWMSSWVSAHKILVESSRLTI